MRFFILISLFMLSLTSQSGTDFYCSDVPNDTNDAYKPQCKIEDAPQMALNDPAQKKDANDFHKAARILDENKPQNDKTGEVE